MLKVRFFGDFCVDQLRDLRFGNHLKALLSESDINVVNLEAPILASANAKAIEKSGPSLFQDVTVPEFLERNGFNVILLANNHAMDFGESALLATKSAFSKAKCVGAGKQDEAYAPLKMECGGKKLGILAVCQNEFGMLDEDSYLHKRYGVAWLGHPLVDEAILKARKECDWLVVVPHAGLESFEHPLPELRTLYRHFITMGADAVVGGHPHVPQGVECYRGKPIFYSLGNFCFDMISDAPQWYNGMMAELSFDENGVFFSFMPLSFDIARRMVEIDASVSANENIRYLSDILCHEKEYLDLVNSHCLSLAGHYDMLNEMSGYYRLPTLRSCLGRCKRILVNMLKGKQETPLQSHYINNLRCETHRWVLSRIYEVSHQNPVKK